MIRLDESLTQIALTAIETTVRLGKWDDLCDQIARMLEIRALVVMAYDLRHHRSPLLHCSEELRRPEAFDILDRVRKGEVPEENAGYTAIGRTNAGYILSEREVYRVGPNHPLPRNPHRERVLKLLDARSRYAMRLNDVGPFLDCAISIEGGDTDVSRLSGYNTFLTGVLSKTMEASRIIATLSVTYNRMLTLFDGLAFAAAFCDRKGNILHANRTFIDMARDRDSIVMETNVLAGTTAGRTQAMHKAIQAALSPAASPKAVAFALDRRSGKVPLIGYAAPVKETEFGGATVVLLVLLDPQSGTQVPATGLAAFGVLSPAELQVSELLVRGLSTVEIAEHRDTSEETTRGQVKASLTKLSCRSRLDMVRLALSTQSPIANAVDPSLHHRGNSREAAPDRG
ncbi:regulatory LuxR family protein [Palleronia aestuarii]|uniref:Regulatory LuxR family protein n=1 Tax=Palleronia aestuarii TaxID=568105 RepID=A0A2W7MRS8_9RHOB|nr:helix-turn-helix transcriptional regulator [Palleronia aestuarii]PZX10875.1 regulatory LuxR family protein [Palleronia aestuarii]